MFLNHKKNLKKKIKKKMKKKQDPDQIPLTGRPKTSGRLDRSSFK